MGENGWRELFRLAAGRGGVACLDDARALAIADSSWFGRIHREGWQPLGFGVHAVPGHPVTDRMRQVAAILGLGDTAALSHRTAAVLHGIDVRAGPMNEVHVVVPASRCLAGPRGTIVHRSRRFDESDCIQQGGLRVTNLERTLSDIAPTVSQWQLEALLLQARQQHLLDEHELARQLERRQTVAGRARLRAAVGVLADDSDSLLEHRVREALRDGGLDPSSGPVPVDCAGTILHVDVAFPGVRLAIECDGKRFHTSVAAFEADRRRWRLLRQAGWRIVWVTWHRIHAERGGFLAEVRHELDRPG